MEAGMVRLKWEVDTAGYELIEREERGKTILTNQPAGTYIVPRGGKVRTYDIGLRERDVFRHLANTSMTDESVLAFTNEWGQLYRTDELSLSEFFETRASMRWSLTRSETTIKNRFRNFNFGPLRMKLENNRIVLRAFRLSQFCWMERFDRLGAGADIRSCPRCGTFLPLPKDGRPQKYCSNSCKQAMYRRNKKVADC